MEVEVTGKETESAGRAKGIQEEFQQQTLILAPGESKRHQLAGGGSFGNGVVEV